MGDTLPDGSVCDETAPGNELSLQKYGANILRPVTFAFLIMGAMLPYWFTAMTMKSVGQAANDMVKEVQRQFEADPELLNPNCPRKPDYAECIAISTNASLVFSGFFLSINNGRGL